MYTYPEKTALITGASSGIGAAFAKELAARGMNVILVARSREPMEALAKTLKTEATIICADLSTAEGVASAIAEVHKKELPIDLLINNAGFGTQGPFAELDPQKERSEINLNIAALTDLTHAFLPDMLARKSGGIINVASTAAFQPIPTMAVYAATKAYVLSFTEALAVEYAQSEVSIVALCPGATETGFFVAAGNNEMLRTRRTSEQVVTTGLLALEQCRSVAVDGLGNAISAWGSRLVPRRWAAKLAGQIMKAK